jgi:hypothetical protein
MKKLIIAAVLFGLNAIFMMPAHAINMAGLKIPDTVRVKPPGAAPISLTLNGAGIRYKVFFKVYVAALYLPETKTTAEEVLGSPGPKQINLTMLRDIESSSLAKAFNEGVKRNTSAVDIEKLSAQFDQLNQLFTKIPELKKGDVIALVWVPDVGTMILFNGKKIGDIIMGEPFYKALLGIWLGKDPVSAPLKDQLLGGQVEK